MFSRIMVIYATYCGRWLLCIKSRVLVYTVIVFYYVGLLFMIIFAFSNLQQHFQGFKNVKNFVDFVMHKMFTILKDKR